MPDNANQQTFVVHKAKLSSPFLRVNINDWMEVHRELGMGAAFSLWLWYASNADGFRDDIYPVNITQDLKMGKQSYYNARDKLIHYGYLIVDKERNYEYHYYEKSPIRDEWRRKIKKNCSDEKELQVFYKDLVHKNINIDDMTIDEWWLYNRGKKNNWDIDWSF